MSPQLLVVVCVYLGAVGVLAVLAASGIPCVPAVRTGLLVGELLLVVQLVIAVTSLLRGHRPAELATHFGYAVVSVALLPVLTARSADPPSRIDHLVTFAAAATTIVVTVRLHATWKT